MAKKITKGRFFVISPTKGGDDFIAGPYTTAATATKQAKKFLIDYCEDTGTYTEKYHIVEVLGTARVARSEPEIVVDTKK